MKKIGIIILIVALIGCILDICYLNYKYDENELMMKSTSDSLCTVIELNKQAYDSLKIHSDSLYSYELNRNDSLYQLLQQKTNTNKTKVTYVYKDSIIVKEVENTQVETVVETQYVDRIVEKEVIKTIHDTIQVSKIDTVYQENTIEVKKEDEQVKKEVVVNDDLFNLYLNADIKGNLDLDIVPEASVGIIIKEKFYGEVGIDYDKGSVNPNAKIGLRLNVF